MEEFAAVEELFELEGEEEVGQLVLLAVFAEMDVEFFLDGVEDGLDGLTRRQELRPRSSLRIDFVAEFFHAFELRDHQVRHLGGQLVEAHFFRLLFWGRFHAVYGENWWVTGIRDWHDNMRLEMPSMLRFHIDFVVVSTVFHLSFA